MVHRRTRLELLENGSQQAIHRRHGVGLFAFGDDDEGGDEPRTLFVAGNVVGIGGRLLIVRPLRQEEFVFGVCGEGSAVGRDSEARGGGRGRNWRDDTLTEICWLHEIIEIPEKININYSFRL